MKFIHIADLHIGKRVNEFSMLEDQEHILSGILDIIDSEKPDAILLAGDIYDKPVPTTDAVLCFDDFLTKLVRREVMIFSIAGNHDSVERLSFGSGLFKKSRVYFSTAFQGELLPVTLADEYGPLNVYLLSFVKPSHVRARFPGEVIADYNDALRVAIESADPKPSERNVILAHQFVTGAVRSESEELTIGGLDNVNAETFSAFDYVALGHMHRPQSVERREVRYAGSPLKYSFSEAGHKKSVTVIEMKEKGCVDIREIRLTPKRDLVEIRGPYSELVERKYYETLNTDDYFHITLTDEEDILDAVKKLQIIYKNLMKLDYDNARTRANQAIQAPDRIEEKSPSELFAAFYEKQNNKPLSDEQRAFSEELMRSIWEDRR